MRFISILLLLFCLFSSALAQEVKKDSVIISDDDLEQNDSLLEIILLKEVIVRNHTLDYASRKEYSILQNRVYKTYPYAKIAAERLTTLNRNIAKLKTKKEKKKYLKLVEDYIENEFTDKLKKLSRKQGQILVKLIYRQTDKTTFDLIKDYKSSWKAFWSNNTAKLFDIDIKRKYEPYHINEDYLIETILQRAFDNGRLLRQEAATPIDLEELDAHWTSKALELVKTNK